MPGLEWLQESVDAKHQLGDGGASLFELRHVRELRAGQFLAVLQEVYCLFQSPNVPWPIIWEF